MAALLAAAVGGAIYWWTTRLDVAQHPEGFSVGFPPDWEQATVEGALVADGFLPQGGTGSRRVASVVRRHPPVARRSAPILPRGA